MTPPQMSHATTACAVASTTLTTTSGGAPPQPPSQLSLTETLDLINHFLRLLILSSLSIKSFIGRWQVIRSKLINLQSSISDISDTPHWVENPLLQDLLPNLLSALQKTHSLSEECQKEPSSFSGGKLLMQSDIDMSSAALSAHLHDIDLLLKSGVLRQSSAIVLSQPGPGSGKEELGFFIRDLFTRLQIGGIEFKKKALESLLQLLREDEKATILVAKEGDIRYLVHLLESNHHASIREQAAVSVSILASASDSSRRIVFEEGGLGPLLRLLESGSLGLKEKAAMAIEAITADPENAWAVSAYGGIAVLIDSCRSGTLATQTHTVGAIRNVAAVEDIRVALAEEGAVSILLQMLDSESVSVQEKSANCLWILANSGEGFACSILREGGLEKLLKLLQESTNSNTLEHVLRAIDALMVSASTPRILSSSTPFLIQLSEFIKHGSIVTQQMSASILSNLSISDYSKRAMNGCMGSLVKMMECSKPAGLPEAAARSLVLLLTVGSNRKEFVKDEKSVMRLVQMLDPKNESVCKRFPVTVVSAVLSSGSQSCRKKLVFAGAYPHLQKLSEMEVAGAKRALKKLAGNRIKNIFSGRTWRE